MKKVLIFNFLFKIYFLGFIVFLSLFYLSSLKSSNFRGNMFCIFLFLFVVLIFFLYVIFAETVDLKKKKSVSNLVICVLLVNFSLVFNFGYKLCMFMVLFFFCLFCRSSEFFV